MLRKGFPDLVSMQQDEMFILSRISGRFCKLCSMSSANLINHLIKKKKHKLCLRFLAMVFLRNKSWVA
jgi:hypothetical protein